MVYFLVFMYKLNIVLTVCVKFGDDRLRGFGLVRGQSSPFPIYLAGRPYNTLTLPCESVMSSGCELFSQFINITDLSLVNNRRRISK